MKKFLTIIKIFWQQTLTYRFTILAYRIGEMAEILFVIVMWAAIYGNQEIIKGFTFQDMITYILIGNFFNVLVRNFLPGVIAWDIKDGRLSMFLIRPISYLSYVLFKEIGRISLATLLSVLSHSIIILFFINKFLWNFDLIYLALILIMIFLAFILELLLAFLVGIIAFWTDEVDGLYSTIDRIKRFFSGGYFPLSLLPAVFVNISLFMPFAYSFFVPAQLYLKKIPLSVGFWGILIQLIWIALLYLIIRIVWKRGVKKYEGIGI